MEKNIKYTSEKGEELIKHIARISLFLEKPNLNGIIVHAFDPNVINQFSKPYPSAHLIRMLVVEE